LREYFITALSYMALGLFSSLIIGLIIKTAGEQLERSFLIDMGSFAMETKIMGGAIGVAIAYGLKAAPLVLLSTLYAGAFGAELGGSAGGYVTTVLACENGKIVCETTRSGSLITPSVTILVGYLTGTFIEQPFNTFMFWFG